LIALVGLTNLAYGSIAAKSAFPSRDARQQDDIQPWHFDFRMNFSPQCAWYVFVFRSESQISQMQGLEMICGHTFGARGMVIFPGLRPNFCMAHHGARFQLDSHILES
jgi:hypothetical protein